MAVYGSFTYGSGVLYGTDQSVRIVFVARNLIRLETVAQVVVDEAMYTAANYSIVNEDGSVEIGVREVVRFRDDRTTTTYILLLTDRHTQGDRYTLTVSNLTSRGGTPLGSVTAAPRTNTPTKVDAVLSAIPSFLDRRPGAVIASLVTAIGLEDERIGGAVRERIGAE